MTCVSKKYEIKTTEQDQYLQLKMLFLLRYNLKVVVSWGVGGSKNLLGVIFLVGGGWVNFWLVGGTPQYGKPCDVPFFGLHDPP